MSLSCFPRRSRRGPSWRMSSRASPTAWPRSTMSPTGSICPSACRLSRPTRCGCARSCSTCSATRTSSPPAAMCCWAPRWRRRTCISGSPTAAAASGRSSGTHLRALCDRALRRPAPAGGRPGADDQPAAGGAAPRRDDPGEPARAREHLPCLSAPAEPERPARERARTRARSRGAAADLVARRAVAGDRRAVLAQGPEDLSAPARRGCAGASGEPRPSRAGLGSRPRHSGGLAAGPAAARRPASLPGAVYPLWPGAHRARPGRRRGRYFK